MKRVKHPVTLAEARERLIAFRETHGSGLHRAATLAAVIWPDTKFIADQGAGAAASRVLKALGCRWSSDDFNWGWRIGNL